MTTTEYQANHGRAARKARADQRAAVMAEMDDDTRRQVMEANKDAYDAEVSR